MDTGSFPGIKRPGRGVDHPPPTSAEIKERVELYLYSPLWAFMACYRVIFTFYNSSAIPLHVHMFPAKTKIFITSLDDIFYPLSISVRVLLL
jgi:hypothetical protein